MAHLQEESFCGAQTMHARTSLRSTPAFTPTRAYLRFYRCGYASSPPSAGVGARSAEPSVIFIGVVNVAHWEAQPLPARPLPVLRVAVALTGPHRGSDPQLSCGIRGSVIQLWRVPWPVAEHDVVYAMVRGVKNLHRCLCLALDAEPQIAAPLRRPDDLLRCAKRAHSLLQDAVLSGLLKDIRS